MRFFASCVRGGIQSAWCACGAHCKSKIIIKNKKKDLERHRLPPDAWCCPSCCRHEQPALSGKLFFSFLFLIQIRDLRWKSKGMDVTNVRGSVIFFPSGTAGVPLCVNEKRRSKPRDADRVEMKRFFVSPSGCWQIRGCFCARITLWALSQVSVLALTFRTMDDEGKEINK